MLFIDLVVLAWCFVLGASVGSFLNVVAWRLPQGMSLLTPGSHCPACRRPIMARDNVPVLGWLLLRGRCRACGASISPRYPIVEFVTGGMFAALAWPELVGGGWNLPFREPTTSIVETWPFDGMLLGIWLYHATLMSLLLAIALFEFDGVKPPRRFLVVAVLAGLVPPVVWPELRPESPWASIGFGGTEGGLLGGAIGLCLGWAFEPRRTERWRAIALAWAFALVGIFLVPGAIGVAVFVAAAFLVLRIAGLAGTGIERFPRTSLACGATLAFLFLWRAFPEGITVRGFYISSVTLLIGAVVVLALLSHFDRRRKL